MNFFRKKTNEDQLFLTKEEREVFNQVNKLGWFKWRIDDKSSFDVNGGNGGKKWYINPSPQELFNSGSYTVEDFKMLLEGKGPIIKGTTDDEKEKYFKALIFYQKYNDVLIYYFKYFHYFDNCETLIEDHQSFGYLVFKNPISKDKNPKAIMGTIYYNWALYICREFEAHYIDPLVNFEDLKNKVNVIKELWREQGFGVQKTLRALDIGYFGASNEENVENHAFMQDLAFYYGYYIYLQKNGIEMPDFTMIEKNRFKDLK